jgi:hypothetical protein
LAVLTAQIGQQAGDPRLTTAEWWKVKEDAERQRAEEAARRVREEAERRASMPVPANSDWGEKWEKEAAARAARERGREQASGRRQGLPGGHIKRTGLTGLSIELIYLI